MKKCIVDTSSFENVIKARDISKKKESSVKIDVHDLGYQSDGAAAPIPLNMRMERFLSHLKNVESSDIYFKIFQNSINSHKNLSTVLEDFKLIIVVNKAGRSKRIIGVERGDLAIKVDERAFSFYAKDSEGKFQKAVSTKKGMGVFAELYGVHDDYQSKVDNLVSADSKDLSVKDVAEEKKSLDSSDLVELDAVMISGVNRSVEKTEQDFTKSPIGQLDENQISIQGIGTPDILSKIGTLKDGSGGSIVSGRVSRSQRRKGVTPIFPQRRGESSSNEDVGSLEISGEGQTQFDHQQLDFDDESSILSKLESSGLKTPSKDGDDERPNSPFLDLVQSPVKSPYYKTKVTPLAISDSLIHGEVKTPVIESGEKGTGLGRFSANSYEDSDEEFANQSPTPFSSLVQVDMEERSNLGQSSFVEQSDDSVSETVSKTSVKSDELDFSEAKGSNLETPLATRKSLIQDEFQTPIVEAINKSDSGSSEESYEESPESYQNSSEDEKQSLTPLKRRSDVDSSRDVDHSQAINSFSSLVQSSSVDKEEQSNLDQSRRYDSVAETVSKIPVKSDKLDFRNVSIRSRAPKRDRQKQQHSPFAKSDSSVDQQKDDREGELDFPPSDSSRKLVLIERDTISSQRKVVKEESKITNLSSKSSSSINLEGDVGSDVNELLMREKNSKVIYIRGGEVDGQRKNLFSPIFLFPETTRNLESGKMSTDKSDKKSASIEFQSKTETITPREKVISRESMSYRGASILSPSTSISDADAMKPQAGVPQIIECGPAGVWLDTNFLFLYENRESKTKDEVRELAFNGLVAIIDQVTLDFQKNEKYKNIHLKMKDVIELVDYARKNGGVANKFNEGRTAYEKNEGIEQWKVKFSSSFQKYCGERGFHTDKGCDMSAKLTRLPPEVYDILKGRDPNFEPMKNERQVRLSFSGVELSPKTRLSLSPKGQGAV